MEVVRARILLMRYGSTTGSCSQLCKAIPTFTHFYRNLAMDSGTTAELRHRNSQRYVLQRKIDRCYGAGYFEKNWRSLWFWQRLGHRLTAAATARPFSFWTIVLVPPAFFVLIYGLGTKWRLDARRNPQLYRGTWLEFLIPRPEFGATTRVLQRQSAASITADAARLAEPK